MACFRRRSALGAAVQQPLLFNQAGTGEPLRGEARRRSEREDCLRRSQAALGRQVSQLVSPLLRESGRRGAPLRHPTALRSLIHALNSNAAGSS